MEELKLKAQAKGLWNLWISKDLADNIRWLLPGRPKVPNIHSSVTKHLESSYQIHIYHSFVPSSKNITNLYLILPSFLLQHPSSVHSQVAFTPVMYHKHYLAGQRMSLQPDYYKLQKPMFE